MKLVFKSLEIKTVALASGFGTTEKLYRYIYFPIEFQPTISMRPEQYREITKKL